MNMIADKQLKVLLVDDEPDVTELLLYAFRKGPYDMLTASSGQEALDIFYREPTEILVTDIKMPGMSGLELTRKILEKFPATRVIVITAHGDVDTAVKAMKLGAVDFLQKPVNHQILRMSLNGAAEQWRLQHKLELSNAALEEKEAERARMEKIVQRSQKMEAIGLMAGGVAHDLNNILSGITSYPELLLLELPPDSPLKKPIQTIQEAGERAVAVVADLLTVARGVAAVKKVYNLNELIKEFLDSPEFRRSATLTPGAEVKTELAPDLLNVKCSLVHIRKCLLNLLINALEALEIAGIVSVITENRYVDRPLKGYDEVHRGEYVVLSVMDTGPGISPEDLEHIFEPFYTKKIMGRSGTGLGLAVVWNTVQDHDGYIDVITGENGTRFDLYFPACRQTINPEAELPVEIADLQGGGRTVLVIDDEQTQRDIACAMLRLLGYRPVSRESGEAALEYLQDHSVDLLLLDMIMEPGINGQETYERISKIYPGQKAVIASGFSETEEVKKAQALGAGLFLKKPYTLIQLGQTILQELTKTG
jgi:CheY-like chemotaxis protein